MRNALSLSFSSQKTVLTLHSYRWYASRRLDSISDPFFLEISILTHRVCQGNIFQKTQAGIIFLKPEEVTVCVGEITNKSFHLLWLYRSLLINAETSLWLNQVISPEHMKKLGFLQLRWQYWSSGQYSQIDSFLVPLTWSILGTCFRETWNTVPKHQFNLLTSERALTPWMAPIKQFIQWDRFWEGLGSEYISWPQHHCSGHYRGESPSHSLCSANGLEVSLSTSSSHPASGCQCSDATKMVTFCTGTLSNPSGRLLLPKCWSCASCCPSGYHCRPSALRLGC